MSVHLSVCPYIHDPLCHLCGAYSMYRLDGFFTYLAQMITNMRGWVVCNDFWQWLWLYSLTAKMWHIFHYIHSAACKVLNGLFSYLAQIITTFSLACLVNMIGSGSGLLSDGTNGHWHQGNKSSAEPILIDLHIIDILQYHCGNHDMDMPPWIPLTKGQQCRAMMQTSRWFASDLRCYDTFVTLA